MDALSSHPEAQALILTADESGREKITVDEKEYSINIMPIWKWLLES